MIKNLTDNKIEKLIDEIPIDIETSKPKVFISSKKYLSFLSKIIPKTLFNEKFIKKISNDFKQIDKKYLKKLFELDYRGDGDLRYHSFTLFLLTRILQPNLIMETGVNNGKSSVNFLFGLRQNKKGRLISIDKKEIKKKLKDGRAPYKLVDNHIPSYFIFYLHLYHLIAFKNLTKYDYFHHILFVGLGVLPDIYFMKSNQKYLAYIVCNGIPGIIEYGSLVLYKNNKISLYNQKKLNSINYLVLRLPFCILTCVYNYIWFNLNMIKDKFWITLYLNVLVYLNGVFFTYLTFDSFYKCKYLNTINSIKIE